MSDLLVDPFIISLPKYPSTLDATRFVERAVVWPNIARELGFQLVITDDYINSLMADKTYPTFSGIKDLCRRGDSIPFDAHTVHQSLVGILNRAGKVHSILEIDQVLLADDNHSVEPDLICQRLSNQVGDSLREALALCGIHTQTTGENYPFALLTELPNDLSENVLNSEVSVLEVAFGDERAMDMPAKVNLKCPLIRSEENLFESVNFQTVAMNSQLAIEWSWRRAIPLSERPNHQLRAFLVRGEFTQRLEELRLSDAENEAIFQKLACIICERPLPSTQSHELRIGPGGNDPQRVRETDGAKAWRVNITQHGAGYRAHCWTCSNGSIEIAWLGTHNDFHIPT